MRARQVFMLTQIAVATLLAILGIGLVVETWSTGDSFTTSQVLGLVVIVAAWVYLTTISETSKREEESSRVTRSENGGDEDG